MHRAMILIGVVCVSLSTAVGCKKKTPDEPSNSTTYQGVLAGTTGQIGTFTATVSAVVARARPLFEVPGTAVLHAASVNANATLRIVGGSTIPLTGSFDTNEKSMSLSGGGTTMSGLVTGASLSGTYTGAAGASGTFGGRSTIGTNVTTYCGDIFGAPPDTGVKTGVFNIAVADATGGVSGAFAITAIPSSSGYVSGSLTGTNLSLVYTNVTQGGATGTAIGTVQNGNMSGTAASGNPFSGTTSRCQ
jgi:hypothetical protein